MNIPPTKAIYEENRETMVYGLLWLATKVTSRFFQPTAGSPPINAGDTLKFRLSVRIAAASGHRSGTARLWYDGAAIDAGAARDAGSRFNATIGSNPPTDYFLRKESGSFTLNTTAGTSKQFVDVFVDRAVGGNPFKPFGTWSKTFP
jgi:hypothetical protein